MLSASNPEKRFVTVLPEHLLVKRQRLRVCADYETACLNKPSARVQKKPQRLWDRSHGTTYHLRRPNQTNSPREWGGCSSQVVVPPQKCGPEQKYIFSSGDGAAIGHVLSCAIFCCAKTKALTSCDERPKQCIVAPPASRNCVLETPTTSSEHRSFLLPPLNRPPLLFMVWCRLAHFYKHAY